MLAVNLGLEIVAIHPDSERNLTPSHHFGRWRVPGSMPWSPAAGSFQPLKRPSPMKARAALQRPGETARGW
jgi:hypothetical protein